MSMKVYQTPEIELLNLDARYIDVVLCTSFSSAAETEGFQEYQLITDED